MSDEAVDVKPKLNITVQHENQQCTILVKSTTQFKKVFEAAEKRFGIQLGTFKFTFEGKRVQPDETPLDRGMEDGDILDAHLGQVGGALHSRYLPSTNGFREH